MAEPKGSMGICDAHGEPLAEGSRVASTGAETKFTVGRRTGTVIGFRVGPPVVAVRWDGETRRRSPFLHSVDLMWRCPDLVLLDDNEKEAARDAG